MSAAATSEVAPACVADHVDVLLVCSAGGHLLQLSLLGQAWTGISHAWVTLDREDACLLEGERVHYGYGPTERNVRNLLRNTVLAFALVRRLRPKAVVTTGAGLAVPFAWVGRLFGAKVVYVESLTRIEGPSLTLRLVKPVTNRLYVQWPDLAIRLPKSLYQGNVLERQ